MKYFLRNSNRRPGDTSPHVSLFPFLAVLICTMGALVPLLFTISRQARLQAEQAAAAKYAEMTADVKAEREMVGWRIEQMQTARKKTEADIQTARLELGHLEDHSRRLKAKVAELEKTVGEIDRSASDGHAATSSELEELRKQVAEAERQLADAKTRMGEKKRSFAVVPYEGPNSTHRRPIYIECRGDAVVLQPEGVEFGVHDFEGPMGPNNPLAAALRAEREYLVSRNGFDPKRDGEPYPLFLVRPDGIVAYYAARMAMKSWGPEFGYEFIDGDWKLAYQTPDPQMAQVVAGAVESARVVQERLIAAAPRQYASRMPSSRAGGSSGRAGSSGGGGLGGDAGGSRGSYAGGGMGGSRGGHVVGFGGGEQGGGGDFDSWETSRQDPSAPDPFLSGINNPYASLPVGGAEGGGNGENGGSGGSGNGGGSGLGTGGSRSGSGGTLGQGSLASSGGAMGAGSGMGNRSGAGGASSGIGPALGPASGSAAVGGGLADSAAGIAGGCPTADNAATRGIGGTQNVGVSEGLGGVPGHGAGTPSTNGLARVPGGSQADSAQPDGAGQGTGRAVMAGQRQRADEPPDIFASRVAAANAAKNASETPKTRTSDAAGENRGQYVAPLRPGEWRERPEPPPEPVVQVKDKKKGSPEKYRAQDWGLRETAHGAVPITRPVVIDCRRSELVLLPDNGRTGKPVPVMVNGTDSSIDDLVSAVWDRMNQWGMAGRGMYWRPVLHVRVAPDGEQRFADLQVLLANSGLDVVRK